MVRLHFYLSCIVLGLSSSLSAQAATPKAAVDIAPLHSLVTLVMQGVSEPALIVPAEASPHEYSLKPSQATALAGADVVFWVSEDLTPWLEKAMDNIAESATKVEMLEVEGVTLYEFREGATFEGHDHGDDHAGHDDHDHHDEHHGHSHDGMDPHAWLDPENAKVWVGKIRDTLAKADPENAQTYEKNAVKALSELDELLLSTQALFDRLKVPDFVVFHDAYQYFEKRFGISAAGAISLADAEDPSPARIAEIRRTVKTLNVRCVFAEPQYDSGLVEAVFEDSDVHYTGIMDPLGADIPEGGSHYRRLIEALASSLEQCATRRDR